MKRSRGWSLAVSYPVEICSITEHFDDMLCQAISNFAVSWYRLRYLGVSVLVPIVSAPMTNQDTPHVLDFPHKLSSLHPTTSSPYLRAWGIFPVLRSS